MAAYESLLNPHIQCTLVTTRQRSCRKVMFSVVSRHQSFFPQWGAPVWPLPMMHWTSGTSLAPLCTGTPSTSPPLLVTYSSQNQRLVHLRISPDADTWWLWWASGWYTSYWNVFLLDLLLKINWKQVNQMNKVRVPEELTGIRWKGISYENVCF